MNVNYYYVLINTRPNIKLFEYITKDKQMNNDNNYKNPEQGLIVLDEITNNRRFEFYIQPQKVNNGSVIPTYFHVPYGNMEFPELLIRLTYWTTFIYPNWQNAVRVPHVLKMAKKLAKITAKYTKSILNDKLSDKQFFL